MGAQSKAEQAWAGLNARQKLYLSTILDFDQQAEADIKRLQAKRMHVPPAAEWRLITYDIKLPKEIVGYSSVQSVLRKQGEHDSGAGSTLAALRRRDLVIVEYDRVYVPSAGMVDRIRVRLTTAGRAAAKHGAGVTAPASPPKVLMSRWSLTALARLYAAGDRGLCNETTWDREDAAPSWNTLLRLHDRRDGSLIEEFSADWPDQHRRMLRQHRVRLSPLGRHHFAVHRACYAELYPDVDLPQAERVDGAHRGLADHHTRKPAHLLRDTDLRVLAKLVALEESGSCYLRQVVIEAYERLGESVPEHVHAIPSGLLRWQVKDLARSEKPVDRLTAHHGGPLVEVIDVPNSPYHLTTRPTLPLVVLTQHGRDHYSRHADDYCRLYPDLALPSPEGTRA